MKKFSLVGILLYIIVGIYFVGEVLCIVKAVTCNWEPIGKAEVVYTVGAVSGLGGIVGWFDIEDK